MRNATKTYLVATLVRLSLGEDFGVAVAANYIWTTAASHVKTTKRIGILLDASRLGGEDTVVFAAVLPTLQKCCWKLPQTFVSADPP